MEPQRIGLIKPSALGDIVQTLPILGALRTRFPAATLSWVVKREWAGLLEDHPDLDEVIAFGTRDGWRSWGRLLWELRRRRFDVVFDLQGLLRSGLLTAATGAPLRVGLETAREGSHLACNCVLPATGRDVPAHARYWRVAEAVGAGPLDGHAALPISDADRQWARQQLDPCGPGLKLALHLGAAWPTKRWPVPKFAEVASRAAERLGAAAVLVGGPGDRAAAGEFVSLLSSRGFGQRVLNVVGQSTLKQLAALLSQVDVLMSNDSGPMHLAAAVGTPVVGIFTCTSPYRSGPPGESHELVSTQVHCRGSYRKHCPQRGSRFQQCLGELEVDRVWSALIRVLDKKRRLGNGKRKTVNGKSEERARCPVGNFSVSTRPSQ